MTVSGLDLVRASLRWDAAGDRALRALDGAGWEAVMATVRRRDGQALLARRLSRLPALPVPEYVAQELHRFRLDVAIRTLAGLARLGPAIAAAGVPVMALKGLDLGTRLYGDLGARPMGDMDILVRPAHVAIMADSLRAQGFRVAQVAQPPPHHLSLHSPLPGGLPVELHWALGADDGDGRRMSMLDEVWDDAVPMEVCGVPLLALQRHRLMPYLCQHLENHLFETPLTHIWDIAELLEQDGDRFDWTGFWSACDRLGRRKGGEAAMHLVSASLGVTTPAPPLPAAVRALLPDIVPHLGRHPHREASEPSAGFALLTDPQTPWRARWRVLRRILFPSRRLVAAGGAGETGLRTYLSLWRTLATNHLRNRAIRRAPGAGVQAHVARRTRLGQWLG